MRAAGGKAVVVGKTTGQMKKMVVYLRCSALQESGRWDELEETQMQTIDAAVRGAHALIPLLLRH